MSNTSDTTSSNAGATVAGALVGIQVGAVSFVDEGVTEVIDTLSERAGVNALFVATQAFDRGVAGRQVTWKTAPGHGPDDLSDVHVGGSFVTQHPELYAGSVLGPYRAPDAEVEGFDVLGDVVPAAHERGVAVYSFMLENTHSGLTRHVPNWTKVLQVDAYGRTDAYACLRNPDYQAWWLSLVEDQVRSYPLDGIMWGSERQGPLDNALSDGGFGRTGIPFRFCEHCVAVDRLRRDDLVACLDVVDPEPLAADSPLRSMPNVFLSPHIAGVTAAAEPRFVDLMVDEVLRVLAGHRPRFRLAPREGPGRPEAGNPHTEPHADVHGRHREGGS